MSEHYTPATTYHVEYFCDTCNLPVKFESIVPDTKPMQFVHTCPNCERRYTFEQLYPDIRFIKN